MYKNFIHLFVLSCRKATFLIEKQLHTSLSPLEKLQLRLHLSLCEYCRAYKRKAIFLDKLLADEGTMSENKELFSEQEVAGLKEKFKSAIERANAAGSPLLPSSES